MYLGHALAVNPASVIEQNLFDAKIGGARHDNKGTRDRGRGTRQDGCAISIKLFLKTPEYHCKPSSPKGQCAEC